MRGIDERAQATFITYNRDGRQFGEPVRLPGPERTPYCLAVADLNRDERPDIIVSYVEQPGSVYFNTGQGTFLEVPWKDGKGTVYGLAFADFDRDGWPDIVAARSDAPTASGSARNRPRTNTLRAQKTVVACDLF